MDLELTNKVVLVTGASQGMGKAITQGFAEEGANVIFCARDAERLQQVQAELSKNSEGKVLARQADVESLADIRRLVDFALDRFGRIDVLVCNSGGPPAKYFVEVTDEEWQRYLNLNLQSFIRLSNAVIPTMKKQKWGRILFLSSVSVKQPIDNLVISNVVRSGVVGLTKSLSNELGKYNILVNNVCPGYVRTDRVLELAEVQAKQEGIPVATVIERYGQNNPLGRIADPREIADLFLFLASERAGYITGVSLHIDGGFVKGVF